MAHCEHLKAAVLFIEELQVAQSRLREMLGSKSTTDVVEALRFLVTVRSPTGGVREEISRVGRCWISSVPAPRRC